LNYNPPVFMATSVPTKVISVVPTYDKVMLPLLQFASDGKEHRVAEADLPVADHFHLSSSARAETLPDGRNRLRHRIEWARTYLKKAGLLAYPSRGSFKITKRGLDVLSSKPSVIDNKLLMQFPEFAEFKHSKAELGTTPETPLPEVDPEEALENGYQAMRQDIEDELLDRLKAGTPEFFERAVVDLLVKMGYGGSRRDAGRAVGRTGDGGIDGIINEDSLGLDVIYVQAKRWSENPVGRPDIQKFVGALQGHRAKKGVFITTSTFSKDAREYATRIDSRIILIDGSHLSTLMFQHDLGVTEVKSYRVKRLDSDYFDD